MTGISFEFPHFGDPAMGWRHFGHGSRVNGREVLDHLTADHPDVKGQLLNSDGTRPFLERLRETR